MIDAQSLGLLVGIATLGGLVWKMGATTSEFASTVRQLKEEVADLKGMRKNLELIPLLTQRIEQLEKFTSSFPKAIREEREREERSVRRSQGEVG